MTAYRPLSSGSLMSQNRMLSALSIIFFILTLNVTFYSIFALKERELLLTSIIFYENELGKRYIENDCGALLKLFGYSDNPVCDKENLDQLQFLKNNLGTLITFGHSIACIKQEQIVVELKEIEKKILPKTGLTPRKKKSADTDTSKRNNKDKSHPAPNDDHRTFLFTACEWIIDLSDFRHAFLSFFGKFSSLTLVALICISCCVMGSYIFILRSNIPLYTGHDIAISVASGFVYFIILKGGKDLFFRSLHDPPLQFNPYTIAFGALLVGLFSEKSFKLLTTMVNSLETKLTSIFSLSSQEQIQTHTAAKKQSRRGIVKPHVRKTRHKK